MANENFKISQDVELISKKKSSAYPIEVQDWNLIKKRLGRINFSFNYFNSCGSLFIGSALSTFITYFIISEEFQFKCLFISIVCLLLGVLCFIFAFFMNKENNIKVTDVIEDMHHIEKHFLDNE